jgi:hypothetical protein
MSNILHFNGQSEILTDIFFEFLIKMCNESETNVMRK